MPARSDPSPRTAFRAAADGFLEVVRAVPADAWDQPALGVWSVRELVGHAARAFPTIEAYLGRASGWGESSPTLGSPAEYFLAVRGADADAIAQRGREAGKALGPDPAAAVAATAARVCALVAATADDAPVGTRMGSMSFADYLPTRTFELTVHTLDLARSLRLEPPPSLGVAIRASCELAGAVAGRLPIAADVLLVLTGRPVGRERVSIV